MGLSVNFMGMKLDNPIIVAAGPLTGSGNMLRKGIEAGAGAVVTKTIANEVRSNVRPRIVANNLGLQNIELYSDYTLEEWEKEIYYAKEKKGVVIANILAHTPSEMAYLAKKVEKFGADAIELGISIPHGEGIEVLITDPKRLYALTKSAVDSVKIPVMVKFSANVNNMTLLAKTVKLAGASGVSAIDTVRAIIGVDVEKGRTLLPTYGGYSGEGIRPIGLGAVASISQAVNIPISGIGGISSYKNVLEYIMLGASTVQLCTALMLNGFEKIGEIINGIESWMEKKGYSCIEDFRGSALESLKSFEEIPREPFVARVKGYCNGDKCQYCIRSCIYDAISINHHNDIVINYEKCTGCGLCASVCKKNNIYLDW